MTSNLKFRLLTIVAVILVCVYGIIGLPKSKAELIQNWKSNIRLGLDLSGGSHLIMEIHLQDGTSRVFGPGQHFYSDDTLPPGATFDASLHGHWSRAVGDQPLVTAFVRG